MTPEAVRIHDRAVGCRSSVGLAQNVDLIEIQWQREDDRLRRIDAGRRKLCRRIRQRRDFRMLPQCDTELSEFFVSCDGGHRCRWISGVVVVDSTVADNEIANSRRSPHLRNDRQAVDANAARQQERLPNRRVAVAAVRRARLHEDDVDRNARRVHALNVHADVFGALDRS